MFGRYFDNFDRVVFAAMKTRGIPYYKSSRLYRGVLHK